MSDKSNIQIIENEDAFAKVKKKTNKEREQTMNLTMIPLQIVISFILALLVNADGCAADIRAAGFCGRAAGKSETR